MGHHYIPCLLRIWIMNILGFGDCDGILMGLGFVGSLTTHSYLYVRRRCVNFGLSSFFIINAFMADEEDSLLIIKLKNLDEILVYFLLRATLKSKIGTNSSGSKVVEVVKWECFNPWVIFLNNLRVAMGIIWYKPDIFDELLNFHFLKFLFFLHF